MRASVLAPGAQRGAVVRGRDRRRAHERGPGLVDSLVDRLVAQAHRPLLRRTCGWRRSGRGSIAGRAALRPGGAASGSSPLAERGAWPADWWPAGERRTVGRGRPWARCRPAHATPSRRPCRSPLRSNGCSGPIGAGRRSHTTPAWRTSGDVRWKPPLRGSPDHPPDSTLEQVEAAIVRLAPLVARMAKAAAQVDGAEDDVPGSPVSGGPRWARCDRRLGGKEQRARAHERARQRHRSARRILGGAGW